MYIDYIILGVLSVAMCVYAYIQRPGSSTPDDDGSGGLLMHGDGHPIDSPPSIDIHLPDRVPDDESTVDA